MSLDFGKLCSLLSDQREINEGARSVNMLSLFFPQMKVNGFAVPGLACGVERKSHFSLAYSCSAQSKEDSLEKKMGGNCPDLEIFLCSDFFGKDLIFLMPL